MFTRDKLDKLDSGTIFASGIDFDGNDGIHLWNTGNCSAGLLLEVVLTTERPRIS